MILFLLVLLVLAERSFCASNVEQLQRFCCKNLITSQSCGDQNICLSYWKSSPWSQYGDDLSAKCTFCRHLKRVSTRSTEVHRLCSSSGVPLDVCTSFVESWKWDNKNENSSVAFCNALSMCNSHTYLGDLDFGGSVCEDCKKIFEDVRKLLEDKATSDAIVKKMDSYICAHAPTAIRNYCEETVKAHVPAVLHLIEMQINPQDICTLLGICSPSKSVNVTLRDLIIEAKPEELPQQATHTHCDDDIVPWYYERHDENVANDPDTPSCDDCKNVLNQIRKVLNDPETREEIKKELDDKLCSQLPSFLQTACDTAINSHFDEMIANLNKTDLGEVCATFGMCPNPASSSGNSIRQISVQPGIPVPGVCELCEVVVDRLITLLVGDFSHQSIARALDELCRSIPSVYKTRCTNFMERYGAKIIEAIIEHTAPKIVCTSLGVCGPIPLAAKLTPTALSVQQKIEPCSTCKLFVTVIQQQLELNQTKEGLDAAVKRLCALLPGSYGEECKNLVDIYLSTVIDYIAKSMTPEQICEEIGICRSLGMQDVNLDSRLELVCQSTDLNVVCLSWEVARKCDMLEACLVYRQSRYLIDHLQSPEVASSGCSVCAELVGRWKLFKRLYGRILENGQSCVNYQDSKDRLLCQSIVGNRFKIQHRLMDSTVNTVQLCQLLNLCSSSSSNLRHEPGLDRMTQALITTCSMDYEVLCSKKRLAALCGKTHFCQAFHPNKNTHTTSEEQTETPIKPTRIPMLGENPCTWGPTYWCSKEEHARECGPSAVEHCRRLAMGLK